MKIIERIKRYGRLEGCICEQFAYLPNKVVYPNSPDMNKLDDSKSSVN